MRLVSFATALFIVSTTWSVPPASGSIIVGVGTYSVSPGALITAQLTVSDSSGAAISDIEGMAFTVQIDSGTATTPKITSIDLLTGTIWSGHVSALNVSTPTGGNQLQYQSRDVLTDLPADFVNANGILGTVKFDTTGAATGDYVIKLIGTKSAGRDSVFLNGIGSTVPASFGEGKISIVIPEPATALLLIAGILSMSLRRRPIRSIYTYETAQQPSVSDTVTRMDIAGFCS